MNIFDIIGPVMIGPSSSHTAGAVRLGRVVNKLIDGRPLKKVEIILSGSFARTGKGHGTDRALLAGIMGYHSYAPEVRDAIELAEVRGIDYSFRRMDIKDAHPNTVRISYYLEDGSDGVMQGSSVGGGNILVSSINDMQVEFTGMNHTLLVMHEDKPGVIAEVTNLMHWKYEDLNISNFHLSRQSRGGEAVMTIELDGEPPEKLIGDIRKLDNVRNAFLIKRL